MNKKNTAVICLSPYSGGMELDTLKLVKKLSPYMNVTLIAREGFFIEKSFKEDTEINGIELQTIKFRSSFSFNIIYKVRQIVKENSIENVLFFGASELKSLYFSFLGMDINLIIRHGTTKSRPKKDWFHRLIYSRVNYHISICKHLKNNVDFIIPFGKSTEAKIIYSSLLSHDFSLQCKAYTSPIKILHIGRVVEGKGQAEAMRVCSILEEHGIDFTFDIVGDIEEGYKDEFMSIYNSLSYKNKINLIGFTKNVKSYFKKCDIFLFPSHGEGLGNAFLEALSYGLYCISYSNTSFPELKSLGFEFKLVKDRDVESLRDNLLEVVKNIDEMKSHLIANQELAKKQFSLEKELSGYLSILR